MIGLRGRLVTVVVAVLALLMAVSAALVLSRSESALEEVDYRRFRAITEELAVSSRVGVLARSSAMIGPALDRFATVPDLVSVVVEDENGATIASKTGVTEGPFALEVTALVRTETAAPAVGSELDAFGIPGRSDPRLVGKVVARFSRVATRAIEARLRREIILAFLVFGGLGCLLILLLTSSWVRRIERLARAADRVKAGDLEVRVQDPSGDELGTLARDFDAMTESLRAQRKALADAAQALAEREALAAIGRATAVIAHELRNPLGILLGAAQIAQNPARPADARMEAARMMEGEVRRLDSSLSELLAYVRPRAPAKKELDLRTLLVTAKQRASSPGGPAEKMEIEVTGDPSIVLGDEQQIGQILLNLITNAAQAGAKSCALRIDSSGDTVRVHAEDDGPGIDAAVRDQLFLPFVTTKQRGTGLGLAASRRMARDNGGDLSAEPGRASKGGAHFVLELLAKGDR
jgi:signal transduction histidine kinase